MDMIISILGDTPTDNISLIIYILKFIILYEAILCVIDVILSLVRSIPKF